MDATINNYSVRVRENGDVLEYFTTIDECIQYVERNEEEDRNNGDYTKNWYEVYNEQEKKIEHVLYIS